MELVGARVIYNKKLLKTVTAKGLCLVDQRAKPFTESPKQSKMKNIFGLTFHARMNENFHNDPKMTMAFSLLKYMKSGNF